VAFAAQRRIQWEAVQTAHEQSRSPVRRKKGPIEQAAAGVAAEPEGALVYEDESWFVGKAYGGRCWGQRGRPTWIPAFGPTQGEAL